MPGPTGLIFSGIDGHYPGMDLGDENLNRTLPVGLFIFKISLRGGEGQLHA